MSFWRPVRTYFIGFDNLCKICQSPFSFVQISIIKNVLSKLSFPLNDPANRQLASQIAVFGNTVTLGSVNIFNSVIFRWCNVFFIQTFRGKSAFRLNFVDIIFSKKTESFFIMAVDHSLLAFRINCFSAFSSIGFCATIANEKNKIASEYNVFIINDLDVAVLQILPEK